ncbi:hypothetical protein ACIQOW_03585 [Kitasatospora sp. NPDC091335]|uniref:hypothetical protein n=1 Tax=Kitasatospora sp. NPDC091335 TaxID=3364085 RepID=UPI0038197ACE
MTHTPGRVTLTAALLDWLLQRPGPITLTTGHSDLTHQHVLRATVPAQPPRTTPATGGPWRHTIPAADVPALRAWLARLTPAAHVRIGTAHLADGTGLLLTARTGTQSIRLHQPTPTTTEETTR